jgi:streptogramin lyase
LIRRRWIGVSYVAGTLLAGLVLAGLVWRQAAASTTERAEPNPGPTVPATPPYVTREIKVGPDVGYLRTGLGAVWVAHGKGERTIARVDAESGEVLAQIPLGRGGLEGVAVTRRGLWFFTPGEGFGLIDPETNRITARVPFRSEGVDLVEVRGALWFSSAEGEVRRLDPGRRAIGPPLRIGRGRGLNLAAYGEGRLWVANQSGRELVRIDLGRGRIDGRFPLPAEPFVVSVGAGSVWVTSAVGGRLWQIDPATGKIEYTVQLGHPAGDVAASADAVWVRAAGDRLIEVHPVVPQVVRRYRLPASGVPFAVERGRGVVWVSNWSAGTVWRIRPQGSRATPHQLAVRVAQVRYTRCMRAHGFSYIRAKRTRAGTVVEQRPPPAGRRAEFNRATNACGARYLDPVARVPLTAAERASLRRAIQQDERVQACMRRRGYRWPRPIPGEGGFYTDDIKRAGIDPDDPEVEADLAACDEVARASE